jgi:hypothetical protein
LCQCWSCIQTCHRLLCGHVWSVLQHVCCASTLAACSRLSTVWYERTVSPDSQFWRDMFDQVHLYNTYSITTTIPI